MESVSASAASAVAARGRHALPHSGTWWIVPCVLAEMAVAILVAYKRGVQGRDLHRNVHASQMCGTVCDPPPRGARSPGGSYLAAAPPPAGAIVEDDQTAFPAAVPGRHKALAAWRTTVFLYTVAVQSYQTALGSTQVLYFFTCWNYALQAGYWGCAALCGLMHWRGHEPPKALLRASNALHGVCLPMSVLVSLVFWGALVPAAIESGDQEEIARCFDWLAFSQHAFNTVFMLVDFSANRFLVHEHHLFGVLVWSCSYCVFVWVQHAWTHYWPYFFLALKPAALLWYSGIIALHICVFYVTLLLSNVKRKYVGEVDVEGLGVADVYSPLVA